MIECSRIEFRIYLEKSLFKNKMGLDMYFYFADKVEGMSGQEYQKIHEAVQELKAKDYGFDPSKIEPSVIGRTGYSRADVNIKIRMFENDHGFFRMMDPIGYLRKANQIHYWLVKNIQDGNDDCECYIFTKEKVIELKETCEKVLKNFLIAPEILPVRDGFFFGSTDYDEYYLEDVKNTLKILYDLLKKIDFEKQVVLYYSSW